MELIRTTDSVPVFGRGAWRVFIFSALTILSLSAPARAQTWDEIFRQKKTQIRYLNKQIAALAVYGGYLKEGYRIAGQGLNIVSEIAGGEFGLHNVFVSSLSEVNPIIGTSQVAFGLLQTVAEIRMKASSLKRLEGLTSTEKRYTGHVLDGMLKECEVEADQLLVLLTSGKLKMKDDERLSQLNQLSRNIKEKSAFLGWFSGQAEQLAAARANDQKDITLTGRLYGGR